MKLLSVIALGALLIFTNQANSAEQDKGASLLLASLIEKSTPSKPYDTTIIRTAAMCFLKGESTSGMNKICIYDCLGSDTAITVRAIDLCPLSINR